MSFTRRTALMGGALTLAGAALPRAVFAQGTKASITFGPSTPVYALSPVAIEKGYAKEEAIDLALVVTDAGSHSRQALAAGEAMFGHGDASHPLQLTNRGKKAKMILATQMVASTSNMVIRKDLFDQGINTVEALAAWKRPNGAKPIVAATGIGSGTWMFGTHVFETRKLGGRVTWVAGGGSKTMLAGLQTKQFDAIMAPPSWQIEAERNGFGASLYDVRTPGVWERDFGGTLPVLVVFALQDTIEQQPKTVQLVVNALYRAMKWIKASSTDDIFALIGEKYYGSVDPIAAKTELVFDKETWAYTGRIAKEDFARGGRIWYRDGTEIPPTDYDAVVDMRFLDVAQKKYG
jgi:NitT/TauT family transport system substrate-binding protein